MHQLATLEQHSGPISRLMDLVQWSRLAGPLSQQGLAAWRNRHRSWAHREAVPALSEIKLPLNYLFVEETEETARQHGHYQWKNESLAIQSGTAHLAKFIAWVDAIAGAEAEPMGPSRRGLADPVANGPLRRRVRWQSEIAKHFPR
jgi:hypothetical protein